MQQIRSSCITVVCRSIEIPQSLAPLQIISFVPLIIASRRIQHPLIVACHLSSHSACRLVKNNVIFVVVVVVIVTFIIIILSINVIIIIIIIDNNNNNNNTNNNNNNDNNLGYFNDWK